MFCNHAEAVCARAAILVPLLTGLLAAGNSSALGRATDLYNHADYAAAAGLLAQQPPGAQSLELRGQCYYMEGDFKQAVETLEKAAELEPSNSMIQTWLARAWGGRAESAFAFAAFGDAQKARAAFENAVRLDPANTDALNDLFDFYLEAPGIVGGGIEKAQNLIPRIQRLDPIGALLARARVDEESKQFGKAEAGLREAIALGPGKAGLVLDLAQFLSRRGRYDDSEKAFARAAALAPDSPRILFAKAAAYIGAKRNLDQARDLLKNFLASPDLTPLDPPRWEARKLLRKAKGA